ncbi:MAG: HAD family hydrolase [Sphingobacteriia bacterium]|nr:HAD family hydrolase [Sphingobacteriia bacterium]
MAFNLLNNIRAIIWDWNGTLLDDLEVCINAMNRMLKKRNYPLLTEARYKEIFTFPVQDYYVEAGFDFSQENWDTVAMEFIANYRENVHRSVLHGEVINILQEFRSMGKRQFILSAMQQDFLMETITARLDPFIFEVIAGLNDHYAATKVENARLLVQEIGLPKSQIIMIGDTIHDFEVAEEAGIGCILVSNGHQSMARLEQTGATVVDNLIDLLTKHPDKFQGIGLL